MIDMRVNSKHKNKEFLHQHPSRRKIKKKGEREGKAANIYFVCVQIFTAGLEVCISERIEFKGKEGTRFAATPIQDHFGSQA